MKSFAALETDARAIAERIQLNVDRAVYEAVGKDPMAPLLYGGDLHAQLGFFGRDPGREEIKHGQPLIGTSGQRVRREVEKHGVPAFYANTVPYKPVGNKAWGEKIILEFHAAIRRLLVDHWQGSNLVLLGTEAFTWFALETDAATQARLEGFWNSEERYTGIASVKLASPDTHREKTIRLLPLPHPSPLNVRWFKKFPALLEARFGQVK